MEQQLAVVDASLGETPAARNLRRELDADVTVYKVSEGEFPPSVSSSSWRFDGVVISGSQTAVYEDRDWIHRLTEWFRDIYRADVPVLGICWGHQFVAQALGGRVVDMMDYELGYESVSRVGSDPLFAGIPAEFVSFETHSDRVAEVPPGAATLARNGVGVQAFRIGTAYGIQFHPEYDRQTAVWVTESKDLPDERVAAVLDGITDDAVDAARVSTRVFDNFRAIVDSHQPVRRT
jgi:GMP synthase (glutamine-hydrolysing)